MRAWWLSGVLLLASCRDESAEAFARAQLTYRNLVNEAARPTDARFDAVLGDLRKVPASSRHAADARKLEASINAGRGTAVRTPLALGQRQDRDASLQAQLDACARLAQLAGLLDGGVDQRAMLALEDCRRTAEKLELKLHHDDDDDAPHDGEH